MSRISVEPIAPGTCAVEQQTIGGAAKNIGGNRVKDLANDLRELAHPIERNEKFDEPIRRAHKASGVGYWRCFNIWYGKAKFVTDDECAAVATALDKKRRADRRNELQDLWARLTQLESALAISDPDFHRPTLDALLSRRR